MRKHPERLKQAGIGPARYAELRAICRGYRDLKRDLERARMGIVDKRRYAAGTRGHAEAAARRVRMIEAAAREVGGETIGPALLESVTQSRQPGQLRHRAPVNDRDFYGVRLEFYIALNGRLWAIGE